MAFNGDPKLKWIANPTFDLHMMWKAGKNRGPRSYIMSIEWLAEGADHLNKMVRITADEYRSLQFHPSFPRVDTSQLRHVPPGLSWLFGDTDPLARPALAAGYYFDVTLVVS